MGRAEASEWLRQAVEASYGVSSLHELDRAQRLVVFQHLCGVVLSLEAGDLAEDVALDPRGREKIARTFARYFGGAALDGPPWRLSPTEEERPLYAEWVAAADFV